MPCVNHPSNLFSCKKGYNRFLLIKVLSAWNEVYLGSHYKYSLVGT